MDRELEDSVGLAIELVREALAHDGGLVVLTGAGISAQSGVPTFRGPEGHWTIGSRNYQPQDLATAAAFKRLPREIWGWYLYRRSICRAAVPNPGHRALAELERALPDRLRLVTQNVDGLHLRAGNTLANTLQIHGNIDFARCTAGCSATPFLVPSEFDGFGRDDRLDDDAYARLACARCGAAARPHVLWFDEYYDEPLFRAESAIACARDAALLVVIGTAGATSLPMQLAGVVARSGRPILDINTDDNPFAEIAARSGGLALRGSAATVLPALYEALSGS